MFVRCSSLLSFQARSILNVHMKVVLNVFSSWFQWQWYLLKWSQYVYIIIKYYFCKMVNYKFLYMNIILIYIYSFFFPLIRGFQLLTELIREFLKIQLLVIRHRIHDFLIFPKLLVLVKRFNDCFWLTKKRAILIKQTTTSELIDQMSRRPLQIFVFNRQQSFTKMLIKYCRSCAHHKLYSSSPKAG